jgi:CDP-diacylglycerol--glycerol-3-phosphate 3-phosphatidyltransferase
MSAGLLRRMVAEDGALKLANLVTLSRAALIAPIASLLLGRHVQWALGLYITAALTDFLDGWLARRFARGSEFGAQLDATVDNVFSLAILAFLLLAYPGLADREGRALIVLFGGPLVYLVLSWLLTRRLLMFHFWSAKAGAVLLFSLWPLIALTRWQGWVMVAAILVGFSRVEQLLYIARGGLDLDAPHALAPVAAKVSA